MEKFFKLIMKSGKKETWEGIEVPNQEKKKACREGTLQVFDNMRKGHIFTNDSYANQNSSEKKKNL